MAERVGHWWITIYAKIEDNKYVQRNEWNLLLQKALHMRCLRSFTDFLNVERKNGEEWLIKMSDTETHICGVYEEVVGVVNITTLTSRQYCVILNPVDENGHPQLGKKKLVTVSLKNVTFLPMTMICNGNYRTLSRRRLTLSLTRPWRLRHTDARWHAKWHANSVREVRVRFRVG